MPRPELGDTPFGRSKDYKPGAHKAADKAETSDGTLRSYAHKIEDFASGGAIGATGGARKNMDYGVGGSFNHASEDDGK